MGMLKKEHATKIDLFKQKWTDNDLVYIGPGTEKGLAIISGRKQNEKEQRDLFMEIYNSQYEYLRKFKSPQWAKIAYEKSCTPSPMLSVTNLESAICEYRKYVNIRDNKKGRKILFKR